MQRDRKTEREREREAETGGEGEGEREREREREADSFALSAREVGKRVKARGRKRKGPFYPIPRGSPTWEKLFGENDKLFELERERVREVRRLILEGREREAERRGEEGEREGERERERERERCKGG